MKECTNCGANYQKDMDKCPYCGMQNRNVIEKKHKRKVAQLNRDKNMIKKLPEIIPKKSTRYLVIGVSILVVVFLIVFLFAVIFKQISVRMERNQEEKNIEKMEEYLVADDYAGLADFCNEIPYSRAVYDKYYEVVDLYSYYEELKRHLDIISAYGGEAYKELILDEIITSTKCLRELYSATEVLLTDNKRLLNESELEEIRKIGITDFQSILFVDDIWIDRIVSEPEDEAISEFYKKLSEAIYDNCEKNNFGKAE